MTYAILSGNTITAHGTARQLWPGTSFPRTGPNAEFLADAGAAEIHHDLPHDSATHYLQAVEPYLLDGVVFDREAAEIPPAPVVPRWQEFGAALAADAGVNQMIGATAANAPVLHLMLGVGLGQAAQGDARTFSTAWTQATAAGLVNPDLAAHVQTLAGQFDLPSEFVAGLNPEP